MAAECRSYAEMKKAGWTAEEIGKRFNRDKRTIEQMISVGEIPEILCVTGHAGSDS